jgi:hypothetical protein
VSELERCKFIKSNGERCRSTVGLSQTNQLCFAHDPARAVARRISQQQGAIAANAKRTGHVTVRHGQAPPAPETMEDCARWAAWAAVQVAEGALDPRTASVLSNLLNSFRSALERHESRALLEEYGSRVRGAVDGDS